MYLFGGFGSDAVSWECQDGLHQDLVAALYTGYGLKSLSSPSASVVKQALGNLLGAVGSAQFNGLLSAVRTGTLKSYVAGLNIATGYVQLDSALREVSLADVMGGWQEVLAKNLESCMKGYPSVFTATPTPLLPTTAAPVAVTSDEARVECEAKLLPEEWDAGYFCDSAGRLKQKGADGVERWVVDASILAKIDARVPQYIGAMKLAPIDPRRLVPGGGGVPGAAPSPVSVAAGGGSTGAVVLLGGAAILAALMLRG